jgi:hypothetical protein
MARAKTVGAFSGNANFGLFQSNMVADSFPTSRTSASLLCGDFQTRLCNL